MNSKDNIEKIISETFNNPDVMSFIVKQVREQLEKEQASIEEKNIPNQIENNPVSKKDIVKNILNEFEKKHIKKDVKDPKDIGDVIHKDINSIINNMDKKAKTYLNDNSFLNDYINNKDIFMNSFGKTIEDSKNENNEDDCENCSNHCEDDCDYDFETDYCSHCECKNDCDESDQNSSSIFYTSYTSGYKQTTNEEGKPIGYLYFNFDSNNEQIDIYKQIRDYYSILNLHADEWDNWDLFHYDYNKENFHLSVLIDDYTYHFSSKEDKIVDGDEDDITSFIYTKPDDNLKMFSIYILNYSTKTNKLYDFIRIIITIPDESTETDYENYYINLEKYFSDKQRLINLIEDYTYIFINRFKVNNHIPVKTDEDMYVVLIGDIIRQIKDKINSRPISEPTKIEFKKEDPIDKTNSILDKLGIPYDNNGNVEIPIGADTIDNENITQQECYIINTGNHTHDEFLSKAIQDGRIKVEVISNDSVCINVGGTFICMKNHYNK